MSGTSSGGTEFKGYGKMSHSTQSWQLSQQDHNALFNKVQWVVTEKVHGANCCFIYNVHSNDVQCAKRRGILGPKDDFFNYQSLLPQLEPKLQQIHTLLTLSGNYQNYSEIHLFGEIFGGYYPGLGGSENDAVQTGIYYSPNVEFYAFDVALQMNDDQVYLHYTEITDLFAKSGIMYNEPLYVGKFEQCMDYNIHFNSRIPQILGHPALENNKAEGVVIRPMKEIVIQTKKGPTRPLLKRKIEEFSEERFDMKQKPSIQTGISNMELLEFEISGYATMNRLNNAISKLGRPDAKNKQQNMQLLQMFVDDILESLADENEEMYSSLSKREREKLRETTEQHGKQIIYEYHKQQRK